MVVGYYGYTLFVMIILVNAFLFLHSRGVGVGVGLIPKGKGYHRNSNNCELTLAGFQADDESRENKSGLGHFPNLTY